MQTQDSKRMRGDKEFASIVARFASTPELCRPVLRELRDNDPEEFTRLAVLQIGLDPTGPATGILSLLLSRDELYLHFLTDPGELTHQQGANAARVLATRDKRFYVKLTGYAGDSLTDDRVTRVLQIAEALGAAGLMVPWLRRMTRHPDGYIRQKAVMIMCQAGSNPLLVERQLQSADPRVRANAVESLWSVVTPASHLLLEHASQDPHHRVALNALVGLFLHGDASAIGRMSTQTRNSSPAFRAAAAWALGFTGKSDAWPALQALLDDMEEVVRESALRALEKVPEPKRIREASAGQPGLATEDGQVSEPTPPEEREEAAKPGFVTPEFRLVS